jgi:hypothetical protein
MADRQELMPRHLNGIAKFVGLHNFGDNSKLVVEHNFGTELEVSSSKATECPALWPN